MTQTLDDKSTINNFVSTAPDDERLAVLKKDGKLTLTDAQKQAVLTKGRVIVSAAAGSGKTSTMVKRIILMIAEGYSLRNMLVLVYNVAAADELKERLHKELFDRACSEVGEARERFSRELDDLPFCHICTIHSFCNSLLRDNFDKLGLSPTFEVLDEQAHAAYMNEALENVFSAYSEEGDDTFMDVVEIFSQARKEDNLKANIIKLHNMIDIQPDKKQFFDNVNSCYKFASIGKSENIYDDGLDDGADDELDDEFDDDDFIDIWDEDEFADGEFGKIFENHYKSFFEDALKKFEEIAEMISGTVLSKHIEAVQIASVLCQEMLAAADFNDMLSVAYDTEKPSLKGGSTKRSDFEKTWAAITKFYNDELFDVVKEMCELKEIWDDSDNKFAQNALYVYKLLEITSRFDNELARLKKENNVLSFEDLQHLAVSLLKDYPSLGRVYDAVFVDEYQDVNPTQEFIIQKLIKGECFMVGDVKQSIYGFRLADPKIFLARQERYKNGGGTAIDFNRNFRSKRKILSFVNGVFNTVMTEKTADVDYKNTAAFEIDGMPDDGRVEVHLFTDKKGERVDAQGLYDITDHVQAEEGVKASISEGKFIAREIKSLVGRAKTDDGKIIGYGDIAILFRSRTAGAQQIIEVLRSEGIPVDESVFGKSESRPERELISMLRVLDNPRQDIPLAGFMLSFFGGYGEDELAFIAAQDGECLYDKVRCVSCEVANEDENIRLLADKLRATLSMLDTYRIKASFKNVSELMSGIVSDFCYDAYLTREGEAEVYGLKEFIMSASSQSDSSLGKFLDGYSEGGDSRISAGGGERVHISTFHGYKGLEIPITFVADTAVGFNYKSASADLVALGKGYIGLKYFDFKKKLKYDTASRLAVAKLYKQQCVKEEMRLFYVALTRAKQTTFVTASISETKNGEFGFVDKIGGAGCNLDFISSAICRGSVDVPVFRHLADDEPLRRSAKDIAVLSHDGHIVDAIRQGREHIYPHKTSTKLAMKYSVSALDSMDEQSVRVFEDGASVGTAYHKVMQYIDFFARGEQAVRGELDRLVKEEILSNEERALIDESLIVACLDSEIIELARDAQLNGKCMREQPFMMYKPANELREDFKTDDKVLVQGVIDLFIRGKQNVLVDFKCSKLNDEKLVEKYKTQLNLYKTAIESALSIRVDRVLIYSFHAKHAIDCM